MEFKSIGAKILPAYLLAKCIKASLTWKNKQRYKKLRKIKKVIIKCSGGVLSILLVIAIFILLYLTSYIGSIINFEDRIVEENDNVLMANVLYNTDEDRLKLAILITLENNQWIVLNNATIADNAVIIENISGYVIRTSERITDEEGNVSFVWRYTDIIHTIGIQRSVNEILQNFDKLAAYMDNLEEVDIKIYSGNQFNHEWYWSDEANLKRYTTGEYERVQFKTLYWSHVHHKPLTYSYYYDAFSRFRESKEKWRRILGKTKNSY
jgi:hypothetical protein